jgi:ParB family transcriptional regulator, chromosome partitioning protein
VNARVESLHSRVAPKLERIPLDLIDANPEQPRETFDRAELERLALSLTTQGMLQPIILRSMPGGRYQIVAGERRWRAALLAGWQDLPALVRHLSDAAAAEIALAENELRVQVSRIETARAAQAVIESFGHTHEELGAILGMDRVSVTNLLRLLTLDPTVQQLIGEGARQLSAGHAKVLIGLTRGQQRTLADRVIREGLSVRALERLVKDIGGTAAAREESASTSVRDPNIVQLEQQLTEFLCQPVAIDWRASVTSNGGDADAMRSGKGQGGEVTIRFSSLDELDGFLARLRVPRS